MRCCGEPLADRSQQQRVDNSAPRAHAAARAWRGSNWIGEIPERGMPPPRIVPALDDVKDLHLPLGLVAEAFPLQKFALRGGEERFAHRVVVRVADRSHRGRRPACLQRIPKAIDVYCVPWSEW